MLRAFVAATSMLKTVASGMRYRPMIVPSRSATAIAMRADEPMGRRITARVLLAVAIALLMIAVTSDAERPPSVPAAGATSVPSGVVPGLAAGPTTKPPVKVPALVPAGGVV